jgi:hypothetical protein
VYKIHLEQQHEQKDEENSKILSIPVVRLQYIFAKIGVTFSVIAEYICQQIGFIILVEFLFLVKSTTFINIHNLHSLIQYTASIKYHKKYMMLTMMMDVGLKMNIVS